MDSYRVEAKAALKMAMADADATVEPVPPGGGGGKGEADIDKLSAIIKTFNDLFGNIEWKDEDKIRKVLTEEIPARVAQDKAYQNAQANSDNAECDKANRVVLELLSDHTELFKQFSDNSNFKRWLTDTVFDATYQRGAVPPSTAAVGQHENSNFNLATDTVFDATYQPGRGCTPKAPPLTGGVGMRRCSVREGGRSPLLPLHFRTAFVF
jgi:type I site-specific restriction-modification system R (restriction) subunit